MKQCKTQTVHGFAQNVTFSISQTLFSLNSLTWKVKIGLTKDTLSIGITLDRVSLV